MTTRSRRGGFDIWPGFVDALATLLIIFIFLLMIFAVSQFFLNQALTGRDEALERVNRQLAQLAESLALERDATAELKLTVAQLSSQLQASIAQRDALGDRATQLLNQRDALEARLATLMGERDALAGRLAETEANLDQQRRDGQRAAGDLADANRALDAEREQAARLAADIQAMRDLRAELEARVVTLADALRAAEERARQATLLARDAEAEAREAELRAAAARRAARSADERAESADEEARRAQARAASAEALAAAAETARIETQAERDRRIDALLAELTRGAAEGRRLSTALDEERALSAAARAQVELLNSQLSALRAQLGQLQAALDASEARTKDQDVQIVDLGRRLNTALAEKAQELALKNRELEARAAELEARSLALEAANRALDTRTLELEARNQELDRLNGRMRAALLREEEQKSRIETLDARLAEALKSQVEELSRFRSEFFGRLREILRDRQDVQIVGDRFVFQSEVFFESGQSLIGEAGVQQLNRVADLLKQIAPNIPPTIDWILQVEGHTDDRPIYTLQFPSNWELSSVRAISVLRYLVSRGIPPHRLSAAGYGEFQPIDPRPTEDARRRNRRIELKLTQR